MTKQIPSVYSRLAGRLEKWFELKFSTNPAQRELSPHVANFISQNIPKAHSFPRGKEFNLENRWKTLEKLAQQKQTANQLLEVKKQYTELFADLIILHKDERGDKEMPTGLRAAYYLITQPELSDKQVAKIVGVKLNTLRKYPFIKAAKVYREMKKADFLQQLPRVYKKGKGYEIGEPPEEDD